MGPFPHDAPPAKISAQNRSAPTGSSSSNLLIRSRLSLQSCSGAWAMHRRQAPDQEHHGLSPGRHQLYSEYRTRLVRDPFRFRPRPLRPVDGVARRRRKACLRARRKVRRRALLRFRQDLGGARDQRRRRFAVVLRRPLRNWEFPVRRGFEWTGEPDPRPQGAGFYYLDHLTHNVNRGHMDKWFAFYTKLFNFRQIRFFDIEGKLTGLFSRALTSPCGRISHSDQRVGRRKIPDRGISARV